MGHGADGGLLDLDVVGTLACLLVLRFLVEECMLGHCMGRVGIHKSQGFRCMGMGVALASVLDSGKLESWDIGLGRSCGVGLALYSDEYGTAVLVASAAESQNGS